MMTTRLKVEQLREEKESFNIDQRWAAISRGSSVGTRNLFNCLGIVIHNRVAKMGIIAHVEARSDYSAQVRSLTQSMLERLNGSGGRTGSLAVVLMGNAGTRIDFDRDIFGLRLVKFDFLDLRGRARGFIYEPKSETLWWDSVCTRIKDLGVGSRPPRDEEHFRIQ